MSKVSIIIPVYNAEKHIGICIDSILNQTFKDIEIIIINDGSTDRSLDICKEYSRNDSRIKLIDKKNEGISRARNTGLLHATGEYISFIDSDDWVESNIIEELYNSLVVNNADFCMCNYIKENKMKSIYVKSSIDKKILRGNEIKNNLIIPLIEREDSEKKHVLAEFRAPWGKLFKRDIIKKNNIKFEDDLVIGEDFIFNLKFLIHASKIIIHDEFYYHYVNNDDSVTMKYKNNCWKSIYKNIIIHLELFLKKNNIYIESRDKLDKLIIKYFLMCINNEKNRNNPKKIMKRIYTIKEICEDNLIIKVIKRIKIRKYSIKNKLILFLAKNKLNILIYPLINIKIRK